MRPLTVIPIALFAAVTGGCHRGEPTPPARDAGPPATVKTAPIAEQTYTLTEDVTGTVRAKTRAVIEARASGRVRALGVTLGQGVAEGEVLAEIDAEEIQTRLDQATAALDQAARSLASSRSGAALPAASRSSRASVSRAPRRASPGPRPRRSAAAG